MISHVFGCFIPDFIFFWCGSTLTYAPLSCLFVWAAFCATADSGDRFLPLWENWETSKNCEPKVFEVLTQAAKKNNKKNNRTNLNTKQNRIYPLVGGLRDTSMAGPHHSSPLSVFFLRDVSSNKLHWPIPIGLGNSKTLTYL